MTTPQELDAVLRAFFVDGTDEVADRVIDAALDQIEHTPGRRGLRMPLRFRTIPMLTRLAAAAVIGVVAIGGSLYLLQREKSGVGTSSPTPGTRASPPSTPGPLGVGRQIHTATTLSDGRVLIVGGYALGDGAIASAVVYDDAAGGFSPTGSLTDARGSHTATLLTDGRVLIAGGGPASWLDDRAQYLSSAELYDPQTGTFSPAGSMTTARDGHTATRLMDGRVLITGGNDLGDHGVASAELYDPNAGTFTATGSMTTARGLHTATLLADGRVLIVGGDPNAWSFPGPYHASAEIYDPSTGVFTATGSMSFGRELHAATLLADGRVLITGGVTNAGPAPSLASAELYDPATGGFSLTASMAVARALQTSTLLNDGRVLISGGLERGRAYADNPEFLASAEVYDPVTGGFSATDSMAEGRTWHAATLLPDGRVLVTGGYGALAPLATAEIYDPVTGTFNPADRGG